MILYNFTDLDLGWWLQGQGKAKPLGFTFLLIRIKFGVVLKKFKLNILTLFLSEF